MCIEKIINLPYNLAYVILFILLILFIISVNLDRKPRS
ncbi:hypothetical protein EH11_04236 [Bacillus subtilis]|nr:hypothetical protein EH11_04236 [Bacillus subtilis]